MEETYGIPSKIEHLFCLIDLLGRVGRLEEAEGHVNTSPFGDDPVIWGSLLSSCRLHGDVLVGERAARRLLELQPRSSSPYVLLSNLYASDGRWVSVAEARKLLKVSGVKKEPGYSLIAVKYVAEKFTVSDFSHARIAKILETLENLNSIGEKMYLLPDLCSIT
nr:pentatricopeptide repeat protein AaPPR1267 [Agave angustifolia]